MRNCRNLILCLWCLFVVRVQGFVSLHPKHKLISHHHFLSGWIQRSNGDWQWQDENNGSPSSSSTTTTTLNTTTQLNPQPAELLSSIQASATPQLPSKNYRPKQSLGQNYLKDPNTVAKIIRAFHQDATMTLPQLQPLSPNHSNNSNLYNSGNTMVDRVIELGPGAGALTDKLVETYGVRALTAIEIDPRSVELLTDKHANLDVRLQDVLQVDYRKLMLEGGSSRRNNFNKNHHHPKEDDSPVSPLTVIGNVPYYITSQILFALCDAAHVGAVQSATITMQYEVAKRMVAKPNSKEYGILSVVFQIYSNVKLHFKIPPTVFYPKPKVDSALVGLHFASPRELQNRLRGVSPADLRKIVTTTFQQRRKTLRNSLKKLVTDRSGDAASLWTVPVDGLPPDWSSLRPEQLTPAQFVTLTSYLCGEPFAEIDGVTKTSAWPLKVWRKLKHGVSTHP